MLDDVSMLYSIGGGMVVDLTLLVVLELPLAVPVGSLALSTLDIRRVGQRPGLLDHRCSVGLGRHKLGDLDLAGSEGSQTDCDVLSGLGVLELPQE